MLPEDKEAIRRDAHEMVVRVLLKVLVGHSARPAEVIRAALERELDPIRERLSVWDSAAGGLGAKAMDEEIEFIFAPPRL